MTIPNIVTYWANAIGAPDADVPPHMKACAAMVPDHRPGTSWLATGPTPEAARQKLLDVWAKQNPPPAKRKVKADPDLDVVL